MIETAGGGDTGALDLRFRAFAERAGIDAIYLMNASGVTIAASNAGTPQSFLGQDYSFRPYFQTALGGTQGQFYGIGATTGIPGCHSSWAGPAGFPTTPPDSTRRWSAYRNH